MPWISVYLPKSHEKLKDRFRKVAKREGRSQSQILLRLMLNYVTEHEPGNPQQPLFEDLPPPEYSKAPVVRRKQVMDDLFATIKANPGCNVHQLIAKFSRMSGLRRTTIREYIQTLVRAGDVRSKGSKVYPR